MENHHGMCYTIHLINYNHHQKGYNEVCKSTVNVSFFRIQHKRKKLQIIQQGKNNEGKWKEAIRAPNETMVDHSQMTSRG